MIDTSGDQRCRCSWYMVELDATLNGDYGAADGDSGVLRLYNNRRIYDVRRTHGEGSRRDVVADDGCSRFTCLVGKS